MDLEKLTIQNGNIYYDGKCIYIGNNNLTKIVKNGDRFFVYGERHTFLEVYPNLLVVARKSPFYEP